MNLPSHGRESFPGACRIPEKRKTNHGEKNHWTTIAKMTHKSLIQCAQLLFLFIFGVEANAVVDEPTLETAATQRYFPPPESQGGWRKNTDPDFIQSLGLKPEKLEAFGQYNLEVPNHQWLPYSKHKGILVIKNGWIIGEWYNNSDARHFKTYLSSNGKAFAIALFGIMAEDSRTGRIENQLNFDSKVYDKNWLPQGFPLSDTRKSEITFEQIFRHTSGLCPERTAAGEEVEKGRNHWTDYIDWVLGHDKKWPQTAELYFNPGRPDLYAGSGTEGGHTQAYSSIAMNHLGLVYCNVYSKPAREFLWERLLEPIGFSGIDYHAPPNQHDIKWVTMGGLRMTPRDYARFSYLLLKDGRWKGLQIVPAGNLERFRRNPYYANIRCNFDGRFGEQYPKDLFYIAGSGVNLAFMVPSQDLIAIRTGRASNSQWDQIVANFLKKLFDAIE